MAQDEIPGNSPIWIFAYAGPVIGAIPAVIWVLHRFTISIISDVPLGIEDFLMPLLFVGVGVLTGFSITLDSTPSSPRGRNGSSRTRPMQPK